jgi:hydroxymethylglutaryl-CoA lyase
LSATFLQRNQNQSVEENRTTLKRIKAQADTAGLKMVAYISMGFGNPYDEPWSEKEVADAAVALIGQGIPAVSIADTIGAADAALISRVVTAVLRARAGGEIGVHLHSTRAETNHKILAAYDAGCRRFDAALGGLGGCPFAQDQLVGNVPTEEVLRALRERGVMLPIESKLAGVTAFNDKIASSG